MSEGARTPELLLGRAHGLARAHGDERDLARAHGAPRGNETIRTLAFLLPEALRAPNDGHQRCAHSPARRGALRAGGRGLCAREAPRGRPRRSSRVRRAAFARSRLPLAHLPHLEDASQSMVDRGVLVTTERRLGAASSTMLGRGEGATHRMMQ